MKRLTVSLAAAAALVWVVGCGGGEASSRPSTSSVAAAPGRRPAGPSDPARNLEQLLRHSNPELGAVSVACPSSEPPRRYPFRCHLRARDLDRAEAVGGQVTVIGIYRPTRTYAFELTYGPGGASSR